MAIVKPPISDRANVNTNEISLIGNNAKRINVFLDEYKRTHKRYGLSNSIFDLGDSAVDGIKYWLEKNCGVAISNGSVYKLDFTDNTKTKLNGASLKSGGFVNFAQDGYYFFMANGGNVVYIDNAFTLNTIVSLSTKNITKIAYFDTYLLALDNISGRIYFSSNNDGSPNTLNFEPDNYFNATRDSDKTVWFEVFFNEILVLGTRTIQSFYNDGTTPFKDNPNAVIDIGCIAPNSVVQANNTLIFLANNKRIVQLSGRTPVVIDALISKEIMSLGTVTDAFAYNMEIEGKAYYVITFPTENRTFAYDYFLNDWSEWTYWDTLESKHTAYLGRSYDVNVENGINIVGSRIDGKIYKASADYYSDATRLISMELYTSSIDYGTQLKKRSKKLTFTLLTGKVDVSNTNTDAQLMIRWQDEGSLNWSNEHWKSLRNKGNYKTTVQKVGLGAYRNRQYHFKLTDNVPFVLGDVEEDVDVLRH